MGEEEYVRVDPGDEDWDRLYELWKTNGRPGAVALYGWIYEAYIDGDPDKPFFIRVPKGGWGISQQSGKSNRGWYGPYGTKAPEI